MSLIKSRGKKVHVEGRKTYSHQAKQLQHQQRLPKISLGAQVVCAKQGPSSNSDQYATWLESMEESSKHQTILGTSPTQLQTARAHRVLMQSTNGAC